VRLIVKDILWMWLYPFWQGVCEIELIQVVLFMKEIAKEWVSE